MGSVPHLPNSHCHSFLLKKVHAVAKSTLSKVQIPRCRKGQSPTTLSEVDVVQNPTLPKKKSKFGGNLTRSGVRVRGLGLVWTSALTRSDRDQGQTRSRTRHRNLTRLVSHVLLRILGNASIVGRASDCMLRFRHRRWKRSRAFSRRCHRSLAACQAMHGDPGDAARARLGREKTKWRCRQG